MFIKIPADKKKKTQAMMEMAILGPVLLIALGILVTYIVKLNGDQYQLMQAFRKALKKAHDENKAVSYGTWDDRRQADVLSRTGKRITSSGSGSVLWAIPSVEGSGESPDKTIWMGVNSAGGRFGIPIEYDLGQSASSGGITPTYITVTSESLTVDTQAGRTSSTSAAGAAEVMTYKIGDKRYPQARAYGVTRSLTGTVDSPAEESQ